MWFPSPHFLPALWSIFHATAFHGGSVGSRSILIHLALIASIWARGSQYETPLRSHGRVAALVLHQPLVPLVSGSMGFLYFFQIKSLFDLSNFLSVDLILGITMHAAKNQSSESTIVFEMSTLPTSERPCLCHAPILLIALSDSLSQKSINFLLHLEPAWAPRYLSVCPGSTTLMYSGMQSVQNH